MSGWIWIFQPTAEAKWHQHPLLMKWQKHTWIGLLYFPGRHTTAHSVFNGLAQIQLHLSTIKEARRNMWPFFSQSMDQSAPSGDNKSEQHEGHRGSRCVRLGFSVDSARGGWRRLVYHSQCPNLALAETPAVLPWPCECVSESSRLINIWEEPRDKQGYIRDGGLIFFWLASGMSVPLVSLVDS